MKLIGSIILGMASLAQAAPSVEPSLYGVVLGKPIDLPECERKSGTANAPVWRTYRPTGFDTPSCLKHTAGESLDVHIQGLTISKNNTLSILLRDGLPDRITIWTEGIEDQDDVLNKLTSRFGKPQKLARPRAQNRMGAIFGLIDAEWRVGSAWLRFSTNTGSLDSGMVELLSNESDRDIRRQAKQSNRDPKL